MFPHTRNKSKRLNFVGFAHFIECKRLNGAFKFTVAYHLSFNINFIEQAFKKHHLPYHTFKLHSSCRVQVNFVGHRGQVIRFLGENFGISKDKFPRFFEIDQCIPYFFNGSLSRRNIREFKVNPFYFGIGGCFINIFYNIIQAKLRRHIRPAEVKMCQRIIR